MSIVHAYAKLLLGLRETQSSRLGAIQWLLDTDVRAEGRSHLMAIGFIRDAMLRPKVEVRVFDHHPDGRRSDEEMRRRVLAFGEGHLREGRGPLSVIADEGVDREAVGRLMRAAGTPDDPMNARIVGMTRLEALRDLGRLTCAILHLGVTPEDVLRTVKAAIVGSVMES